MRPKLDMTNTEQQLIMAAVMTMYDEGKTVHEVMALTNEIVGQLWYAYIDEQKERKEK